MTEQYPDNGAQPLELGETPNYTLDDHEAAELTRIFSGYEAYAQAGAADNDENRVVVFDIDSEATLQQMETLVGPDIEIPSVALLITRNAEGGPTYELVVSNLRYNTSENKVTYIFDESNKKFQRNVTGEGNDSESTSEHDSQLGSILSLLHDEARLKTTVADQVNDISHMLPEDLAARWAELEAKQTTLERLRDSRINQQSDTQVEESSEASAEVDEDALTFAALAHSFSPDLLAIQQALSEEYETEYGAFLQATFDDVQRKRSIDSRYDDLVYSLMAIIVTRHQLRTIQDRASEASRRQSTEEQATVPDTTVQVQRPAMEFDIEARRLRTLFSTLVPMPPN